MTRLLAHELLLILTIVVEVEVNKVVVDVDQFIDVVVDAVAAVVCVAAAANDDEYIDDHDE